MTTNTNLSVMTELQPIAKRMREREELIQHGKKTVRTNMSEVLVIAVEQGRDITLLKSKLGGHATLSDYCSVHIPNMSMDDAAKYVRLSQEWTERLAGQWMFLFMEPRPPTEETKRIPPNEQEKLWGSINKLNNTLRVIDIESWTDTDKDLTRKELEPTAKLLWPDRFN